MLDGMQDYRRGCKPVSVSLSCIQMRLSVTQLIEIPEEVPTGERFPANQPTYLPIVPGMRCRTFDRSYLSRSNENLKDAIREV